MAGPDGNRSLPNITYALGIVAYTLVIIVYFPEAAHSRYAYLLIPVAILLALVLLAPIPVVSRVLYKIWRIVAATFSVFTPTSTGIPKSLLNESLTYNILHERMPIILGGITLNAVGMALALSFPTLMYLDMIGTAVSAFLLGPWYGAIVACFSSAVINHSLFSMDTLSWMPVNIIGGIYWGGLAATRWFRRLGDASGPRVTVRAVIAGGVGAAFILAIGATITQRGLGSALPRSFAVQDGVSTALSDFIRSSTESIDRHAPMIRSELGLDVSIIVMFLVNFVRFVPDKVLTIMLAALFIRTVFPINWNLLVRLRPEPAQPFLLPRQPLVFFVLLLSVTLFHHAFTFVKTAEAAHTPLYTVMYTLLLLTPLVCCAGGWSKKALSEQEVVGEHSRATVYKLINNQSRRISDRFDKRGVVAIFLLVILLMLAEYLVAFIPHPGPANHEFVQAFKGVLALVFVMVMLIQLAEYAGQQQAILDSREYAEALFSIQGGTLFSANVTKAGGSEDMERVIESVPEVGDASTGDNAPKTIVDRGNGHLPDDCDEL